MAERFKRPQRQDETTEAKQQADARSLGDHYLRYWAAWAKDIGGPKEVKSCMTLIADMAERRYPETSHRPEWLDDVAMTIGMAVLRLPEDEQEAVWACYMRWRWRRVSNTVWVEHIRRWHDEDCAKDLRISKRTWYRRLAGARSRIEAAVDAAGIIVP